MEYAGAVAILFFLIGCSATQKIANTAGEVGDLAVGIESDMKEATGTFEGGGDPRPFHEDATTKAQGIRKRSRAIQKQIPKVEDRATWWDKLLSVIPWMAAAAIIVVLGIYAGPAIKGFANRLGWWISPKTKTSAELDVKVLAGKSQPAEAVAARRASDPAYNVAYKAAKNGE